MRRVALAAVLILVTIPAQADDGSECESGIAMIQAEIAKRPPPATLSKLEAALRVARREDQEGEFDECLDAVKDARKHWDADRLFLMDRRQPWQRGRPELSDRRAQR